MALVPSDENDEAERCLASALRILAYRFNSVVELRRKLAAKEFDPAVIEGIIESLTAERWLDDERFAGALVRTRALKRLGPQRIRRDLRAAGVDDDIAARALRQNIDPEAEKSAAIALCEKKMRIIARRHGAAYLRTDEGRKKLAAYLLNHGYEAGRAFEVINLCTKRVASSE
jgi:regulatory protein